MITADCRECGAGPMDLPRDEICNECRIEDLDPFDDEEDEPWNR